MEQDMFERILAETAGGSYQAEVMRARQVYFEQLSDLREDDPSYEGLTTCFLNWYVFDRPMDGDVRTPLQAFAAKDDLCLEERELLACMAANIHSLFTVVRLEEGSLFLKDLFTNEPIRVAERRRLLGLEHGDILEARLLPIQGKLVFSNGAFILHPREARKVIFQAVEKCRREGTPSPQELIQRLQALSFRYTDRFRQRIPIEKIYAEVQNLISSDPSKPKSTT